MGRRIGNHLLQIGRNMRRDRRIIRLQTRPLRRHHKQGQIINRHAIKRRTRRAGHQLAKSQLVQGHRQDSLIQTARVEGRNLTRRLLRTIGQISNQTVIRHHNLGQRNRTQPRYITARNILRTDPLRATVKRGLKFDVTALRF